MERELGPAREEMRRETLDLYVDPLARLRDQDVTGGGDAPQHIRGAIEADPETRARSPRRRAGRLPGPIHSQSREPARVDPAGEGPASLVPEDSEVIMSWEPAVAPGAITQRDLEEFQALERQLSALKGRYAAARGRLLRLVEGHAPVEPGRLRVEARESVSRRVTKAFLVGLFGEEGYEGLRAEAPPTVYRRLVIAGRARGQAPSEADRVRAGTWTSFVPGDRP